MGIDTDALTPRLQAALGDALQLGDLLGVGGFAAVFRARDPFLRRDVAIKVLDPDLALSGELEEQFLREARIMAGVEHPHIVPLYDAVSRGGLLYLVMRLLPGPSLASRIKAEGKLAAPDAARLAHEVAMALAMAHDRGVVHRDIKPDNILLDGSGHATVTDFGISRVTSRPGGEQFGMTTGTLHYMSPEQAMGEEIDGRADVYSLGVVLFEMLTGTRPFEGRNLTELMAKQISALPPKVSEIVPETPVSLVKLVNRLLAKSRDDRPDAAELVALLAAARNPDALLSPRSARWKKRRRRLVLIGVSLGTAVVILWFVVKVVLGLGRVFLSDPGLEPTLSAAGAAIPASLLDSARREGSLLAGERVVFAFIPGGLTSVDAMLVTDSIIIRRSPTGARRFVIRDAKIDVNRAPRPGEKKLRGYFIVRRGKAPADTLYDHLGGLDVMRLLTSLLAAKKEGLLDKPKG